MCEYVKGMEKEWKIDEFKWKHQPLSRCPHFHDVRRQSQKIFFSFWNGLQETKNSIECKFIFAKEKSAISRTCSTWIMAVAGDWEAHAGQKKKETRLESIFYSFTTKWRRYIFALVSSVFFSGCGVKHSSVFKAKKINFQIYSD